MISWQPSNAARIGGCGDEADDETEDHHGELLFRGGGTHRPVLRHLTPVRRGSLN